MEHIIATIPANLDEDPNINANPKETGKAIANDVCVFNPSICGTMLVWIIVVAPNKKNIATINFQLTYPINLRGWHLVYKL